MFMISSKKGLSEIINLVLIILICVSMVSVVFVYVINYSSKSLNLSPQACIDLVARPPITVDSSCFNPLTGRVEFRLIRGIDNYDISSLKLSVRDSDGSKILSCGPSCSTCSVLESGAVRTYYSDYTYDSIPQSMTLIVNGCELSNQEIFTC